MEVYGKRAEGGKVDGGKETGGHSKDQKSRTHEHRCQPCHEDGKHREAQGYCTNCSEYLCQECIKINHKVTLTKNHVLLTKADMALAGTTPTKAGDVDSGEDQLMTPCPNHPDEVTKYYCRHHNKTACTACITVNHRVCKGVEYIPGISKGVADSTEYRDIEQTFTALLDTMNNVGMQASNSRDDLIQSGAEYLRDLKACRHKVMAIIDRLVDDVEKKYRDYVDAMTLRLNDVCKLTRDYSDRITSVQTDISDKVKKGRHNNLFLLLKKAETLIAECKTSTSGIQHKCSVKPCVFVENNTLLDHLHSVDAIGQLVPKRVGAIGQLVTECVGAIGQLVTETVPCLSDDINIHGPTDDYTCDVTCLLVLADGRLLVSDYNNKNIKLFDNNHTLVSHATLQSGPRDIAETAGGEVAVCLPVNNTFQFVSVSATLTPGRIIKTAVSYWSMTRCGDNLAAVHYKSSRDIVEIDMRGKKVTTVWTCPDGTLRYISHNTRGELITTGDGGWVTRVTRNGVVLARYKGHNLADPRGLTVHPDGSIYVCDCEFGNIHHITAVCTRIEVFGDGRLSEPWRICYNQHNNSLYVSQYGYNDCIKVFRLEY